MWFVPFRPRAPADAEPQLTNVGRPSRLFFVRKGKTDIRLKIRVAAVSQLA